MSGTKFDLEDRLLEFAVRVIRVTESMKRSRAGTHVADQLLRAATSPYGNHGEAEGAESRQDFVHKLRVCYKELRESYRWLRLVQRVPLVTKPDPFRHSSGNRRTHPHLRREHSNSRSKRPIRKIRLNR